MKKTIDLLLQVSMIEQSFCYGKLDLLKAEAIINKKKPIRF